MLIVDSSDKSVDLTKTETAENPQKHMGMCTNKVYYQSKSAMVEIWIQLNFAPIWISTVIHRSGIYHLFGLQTPQHNQQHLEDTLLSEIAMWPKSI